MDNVYAVSRFLLSGSGGQGVITMAILLAEAAVKHEGLVAVQSQSYGPEAAGPPARTLSFRTRPSITPKSNSPTSLWPSPIRRVANTCR